MSNNFWFVGSRAVSSKAEQEGGQVMPFLDISSLQLTNMYFVVVICQGFQFVPAFPGNVAFQIFEICDWDFDPHL